MWQELMDYLDEAIKGFDRDPTDSEYQRGYLAALQEIRKEVASKERKIY